jgi:uncharacterized protein YndB with AHSA1/START domain
MNIATETRTVTVERELPFPPDRVWRALTQPHLIAEWLMQNDFQLTVDHRFTLKGDWGHADCQVKAIETNRLLSYSWDAMGLFSTVTLTLTPTAGGTHLRMEQTGFPVDYPQAYNGAKYGWQNFLSKLEQVVAKNT